MWGGRPQPPPPTQRWIAHSASRPHSLPRRPRSLSPARPPAAAGTRAGAPGAPAGAPSTPSRSTRRPRRSTGHPGRSTGHPQEEHWVPRGRGAPATPRRRSIGYPEQEDQVPRGGGLGTLSRKRAGSEGPTRSLALPRVPPAQREGIMGSSSPELCDLTRSPPSWCSSAKKWPTGG